MSGQRLVQPLTLIITTCIAILVVWLNLNYRIKPFVERTKFVTARERVDYQFKQLQYDFYKDKALGWPLDAYSTTLDHPLDSGAVPHLNARELKVIGAWDRKAAAIDAAIAVLIIAGACVVSEIILRRLRSKDPSPA